MTGGNLKRIITSLITLPPLLLLIIYGSSAWFLLLILVVNWLALRELFELSVCSAEQKLKVLIVSLSYFLLLVVFFSGTVNLAGTFLVILFFLFLYVLFAQKDVDTVIPMLGFGVFGILYIGFLLSYLLMIRHLDQGVKLVLFLLLVVWSNDTLAYYVGKRVGNKKLFPRVSPNKTIEGSLAGFIGGCLASLVFKIYIFDKISYGGLLMLPFIVCIAAQLGDLFESLIKRGAGVKDTGVLLPGHGGILDRIDGLLFAAPLFYYYSLWRLVG